MVAKILKYFNFDTSAIFLGQHLFGESLTALGFSRSEDRPVYGTSEGIIHTLRPSISNESPFSRGDGGFLEKGRITRIRFDSVGNIQNPEYEILEVLPQPRCNLGNVSEVIGMDGGMTGRFSIQFIAACFSLTMEKDSTWWK